VGQNTRKPRIDPAKLLGDAELLKLHQLRLIEDMVTADLKRFAIDAQSPLSRELTAIPDTWKLTKGITPRPWQQQCILKWRKRKGRGTVKVVTGAGKTLLALFIAELLQNNEDKDLCVVIVVPTIVLMNQWYDGLLEHGNLPAEAIGRLGGGYDDNFGAPRHILITVLASASAQLPTLVKEANVEKHLLLVADECHRAGSNEMSRVLKTKFRWSLGLSATPERDDDEDAGYDNSILGKKLGPIIYEFNLADALREGLVPKFTINHYGLSMTASERQRYEALSRSITDSMSQLKGHRDASSGSDFFAWARSVASRNQGELGAIAMRFVSDSSKRRELLNHMEARHDAVVELIGREFTSNPDARIILFHESISEVKDLFAHLYERGLPAIMEHSGLSDSRREKGLELFRRGIAQIIVSARSLIEGFNVPAVDVGIIVASSASVRQRIQSLGRMLRRHRGPSGEEKTSCIHVLYAANSSEENIYSKVDWYEATGVDSNKFYLWDLETEPESQDRPPRMPLPTEGQIVSDALEAGSIYPGQYEGTELSCDSQRNVINAAGHYALDTSELAEAVLKIKGSAGKFRVTPKRQFVLVRIPSGEEWETLYVTQLTKPLRFDFPELKAVTREEAMKWASGARPGDFYPFAGLPLIDGGLHFKKKLGGVISKKVPGGEVFARIGEKADDAGKGADAGRLLAAINELLKAGKRVGRIEINEALHVLYREGGQLLFIAALQEGLEFPKVQAE
jgi:superfamily II DNA or RNA helicase